MGSVSLCYSRIDGFVHNEKNFKGDNLEREYVESFQKCGRLMACRNPAFFGGVPESSWCPCPMRHQAAALAPGVPAVQQ